MGALMCPAGLTARGLQEMAREIYSRDWPINGAAFTAKWNRRNVNYHGSKVDPANRPKQIVPAAANEKRKQQAALVQLTGQQNQINLQPYGNFVAKKYLQTEAVPMNYFNYVL